MNEQGGLFGRHDLPSPGTHSASPPNMASLTQTSKQPVTQKRGSEQRIVNFSELIVCASVFPAASKAHRVEDRTPATLG
jgi:hypothetical protein